MATKYHRSSVVSLSAAFLLLLPALFSFAPAGRPLSERVTIRRDLFGIPHILAETEEAAAFGFGYAQAEDHCLAMARALVHARGQQAKVFGEGSEGDFLIQLYGVREAAKRDLAQVSSVYRKVVRAYAAGVNRYVEQHRDELPGWVPVFTGEDVMASRRAAAVRSAFSQAAVRALQRKYPEIAGPARGVAGNEARREGGEPRWTPDDPPGSNAFALGPSRTRSGKPILLGNPHLNWSSLYWEAQVTVPGKINFFGSTLAGIPILRAGFNENLGFVTTNNAPDVGDIFALTLDPDRADHYLFEGKSRPLIRREIAVEVKRPDGSVGVESKIFWESHLGKILLRTKDRAFAVDSSQIDAFRYYEGFYVLSKTGNLEEFRSAMARNMVPTSNFTYADAQGNILYQWNARIPMRPDDGTDYRLDIPAENRYVWKKLLKMDLFPRLLNPGGGYIQNCNNPPWYTSLTDPIDPGRYPSYLEAERELALRPQMALAMLGGKEKYSLEDIPDLKFNTRMLLADRVKPDLIEAIKGVEEPSAALRSGLAVLQSWDNRVSAGSRGAVLFQRFWDTYAAAVEQPYAVPWDAAKPASTPAGISDRDRAVRYLEDAVLWTRKTFGAEDVAWGDVHRFRFGSMDLPGDGASGTYGLFRVLRFADAPDGKRVAGQIVENEAPVGFGDAWVLSVEFTRPVRARSVLAYGQTTRTASKHSADQIRLFAEHRLRPVWFTEQEIRANLEREYHP